MLSRASDDVGEVAPLMAALLGIDGESRYGPLTLTPQLRCNRTLAALIDQLAGLASRRPVLWVIEDAHWIDPTTLELIELALDRVQGIPRRRLASPRNCRRRRFGGHGALLQGGSRFHRDEIPSLHSLPRQDGLLEAIVQPPVRSIVATWNVNHAALPGGPALRCPKTTVGIAGIDAGPLRCRAAAPT